MEKVGRINIFIASSAELAAERKACDEVILNLNNEIDDYKLKAELFETRLSSGNNPEHKGIQDRINKNLLDKCPITICLFHRKAGEWTIEEFERSHQNGKKVFVFLKDEFIRNDFTEFKDDIEKLNKFVKSIEPYVLYKEFKTPDNKLTQFKELVKTQIKLYLKELNQQPEPQISTQQATEKKPPKQLTNLQSIDPNLIIGRTKDLADLTQLLNQKKQVVLMNGMGGIGKTTLAQAYVFQEQENYQHLAWITQTNDDFTTDFATNQTLCSNLGINPENFTDPAKLFAQVCNQLNNLTAHPKLLVIDNALPTLAKYLQYLPKQPNWHLLITSREALPNPSLHPMQLGFLTQTDAEQLFTKHCQRLSADEVSQIVKDAQLHTLTIEILAKAAQHRKLSYQQLSTALAQNTEANIAVPRNNNEKLAHITDYLSSIFILSSLTENQQWLLKQFTCLPPDMHTYTDLLTWINPEQTKQQNHLAELLNELCAQSWLLTDADNEQYKMHPIIKAVCLKQLAPTITDVEPVINSFIALLNTENQNHNPVLCFKYIPFGETITTIFETSEAAIIAVLNSNLATVLQALGDYEQAKTYLQKTLKSAINNFGENHPNVAVLNSNLATVLQDLGDYEPAKTYLQKALQSAINNFGENHPTTAISYSNLATVLKNLGDYEQAKTYLQKALQSAINNFGENHPTTAISYLNLATVLYELKEYTTALQYAQTALSIFKKVLPTGHPHIKVSESWVAGIKQAIG